MTDLVADGIGAGAPRRPGANTAGRLRQAAASLRAHGPGLAVQVVVNIVLPSIIYDQARAGLGPVGALIASSAPPLGWSLLELARHRRVDALSLLSLAGITLSLLAFLGGGSAHLLQLREKLVTALIGLTFLGSAAVGRPLIYQLARAGLARRDPAALAAFEAMREAAGFRRAMMLMTLVWGVGLLGEAALCSVLVFTLSTRQYLVVGPLVGQATFGALGLWSFWYGRRKRRERLAREAAAAPLAAA